MDYTHEEKLLKILKHSSLLTSYNKNVAISVFYDAIKLFYYKQKHRDKPQLKQKEIAQCLNLVYYHHRKDKIFQVKNALLENFGRKIDEKEALEYYEKKVMGIDEHGIDFLYRNHDIKSENYLESRGKRLPWIHYTISNSKEIYEKQESNNLKYLYVSHFEYPVSINEPYYTTFFLVIVLKRSDKSLGFLTAFSVDRYNQFLSKLESWNLPYFRGKK
ncbi:MAG: hypothetical protein FJZ16_06990 [Candidatus Omnitrophica bacterium]|nr:hypothetical protein [Candidatus Omnitrophota bacterium]